MIIMDCQLRPGERACQTERIVSAKSLRQVQFEEKRQPEWLELSDRNRRDGRKVGEVNRGLTI